MKYIENTLNLNKLNELNELNELNKLNKYIYNIARAVGYLHKHNIVHLDIKPSNILVDDDDNIYLIDFSLSCIDTEFNKCECKKITSPRGTKPYIPPELFNLSKYKVTTKSDIYSLGILFHNILLFKDIKLHNLIIRMVNENPENRPDIENICNELHNVCTIT